MKNFTLSILLLSSIMFAQQNSFQKIEFLIGSWSGSGAGFGNSTSKITANYKYVMDKKYIEVSHDSQFKTTKNNEKGEHHTDNGFISFDTSRKKIMYRQFNSEGFVNQYILNDEVSTATSLIFETETIENFIPDGKARLTFNKINDSEIETVFDIYIPNKGYTCYGTNKLTKM